METKVIKVTFAVEFKIGDLVYAITDPEQKRGHIISYVYDAERVMYTLDRNGDVDEWYGYQLSATKNVIDP